MTAQYARYADYLEEFRRRVAAECLLQNIKEIVYDQRFSLADASNAIDLIRALLPQPPTGGNER